LLTALSSIQLTLVLGRYALGYHLPQLGDTVTGAVQQWEKVWPEYLPLPHPSPRNQAWFKQNPWFEAQVLPSLQEKVNRLVFQADEPAANLALNGTWTVLSRRPGCIVAN
jgi:uracil-DNA glycosylase